MDWQAFDTWLSRTNLPLMALMLFGAMCLAAVAGVVLRRLLGDPAPKADDDGHGYVVSAMLGLLALLMGFTFSLAVDRFDARRLQVLEEANAIGTAYLRAQLLTEPHRARMTHLLVRYTDNRIALAQALPGSPEQTLFLQTNDDLITDIWAATSASFDGLKGLDFSSTYLDSINALIDLDASRKTARAARVPDEVFAVLFIYLIATAGVLGGVLKGGRARLATLHLMALLTLSLLLIIDINRPGRGAITESQRPMEELRSAFQAQPPSVYDKFKAPAA